LDVGLTAVKQQEFDNADWTAGHRDIHLQLPKTNKYQLSLIDPRDKIVL